MRMHSLHTVSYVVRIAAVVMELLCSFLLAYDVLTGVAMSKWRIAGLVLGIILGALALGSLATHPPK